MRLQFFEQGYVRLSGAFSAESAPSAARGGVRLVAGGTGMPVRPDQHTGSHGMLGLCDAFARC